MNFLSPDELENSLIIEKIIHKCGNNLKEQLCNEKD